MSILLIQGIHSQHVSSCNIPKVLIMQDLTDLCHWGQSSREEQGGRACFLVNVPPSPGIVVPRMPLACHIYRKESLSQNACLEQLFLVANLSRNHIFFFMPNILRRIMLYRYVSVCLYIIHAHVCLCESVILS